MRIKFGTIIDNKHCDEHECLCSGKQWNVVLVASASGHTVVVTDNGTNCRHVKSQEFFLDLSCLSY